MTNDLQSLAERIGKTRRWRNVTNRRTNMLWMVHTTLVHESTWRYHGCVDVPAHAFPDLETSWPLLLLDMPTHGICSEDFDGQLVFTCIDLALEEQSNIVIGCADRAESVARAWLAVFEVQHG